MAVETPTRPLLRYHGGKWKLAPWIVASFPAHKVYVEPYAGAASVLLRKPRSYAEVYNDLSDDAVNLFRVLRSDRAEDLVRSLTLTPWSRVEFKASYEPTEDPVERARRLVIRSFFGFGSDGHNPEVATGFRAKSWRSGTTPAGDFTNYPAALRKIVTRLRGVVIEHEDALACMARHDHSETLHYVDPPYLPECRSSKSRKSGGKYHAYPHEMNEEDHAKLLDFLKTLRGKVVLSGYPSALYDEGLPGWRREEREALADGARSRVEVLWLSPSCEAVGLFD